jgi:hypothetical protein
VGVRHGAGHDGGVGVMDSLLVTNVLLLVIAVTLLVGAIRR